MISDVLHEALEEISEYLHANPSIYDGEARAKILVLYDQMETVRKYLDTPPEQTVNVKTNVKTG